MIKIVKEEIEIDESLVSRLNVICDFCNTTPIIENGSIREIEHTNLTYIEPHKEEVKNEINILEKKDKIENFVKDPYILEFLDIKDKRFLEKKFGI